MMNKSKIWKLLLESKTPMNDIYSYLQGNWRYKLYYSRTKAIPEFQYNKHPLMRQHIWEQINYRIKIMNPECYNKGQCIKCGCQTTHLQMANKTCEGKEYPPIVSKKEWSKYQFRNQAIREGNIHWFLNHEYDLIITEETPVGHKQIN